VVTTTGGYQTHAQHAPSEAPRHCCHELTDRKLRRHMLQQDSR